MAYTLAHMAAALPFYRDNQPNHSLRWLNFEAMLIGSIMPDLPYSIGNLFINFASDEKAWVTSHNWMSIFSYCLPWGLVLFILWQWWFKPAVFALINPFLYPSNIQHPLQTDAYFKHDITKAIAAKNTIARYPNSKINNNIKGINTCIRQFRDWFSHHFLPVAIAIIFGAATHLIWDGITHPDGFIAIHINWLQLWIDIPLFGEMQVARFLQFFTSIIGLITLVWFAIALFLKQRKKICTLCSEINPISGNKVNSKFNSPNPEQQLTNNLPPVLFSKTQSLIIIGLIAVVSIVIGIRELLKFYPLLANQPYALAAQTLIRWLPKTMLFIIAYTLFFYLIKQVKKHPKNRLSSKH